MGGRWGEEERILILVEMYLQGTLLELKIIFLQIQIILLAI